MKTTTTTEHTTIVIHQGPNWVSTVCFTILICFILYMMYKVVFEK